VFFRITFGAGILYRNSWHSLAQFMTDWVYMVDRYVYLPFQLRRHAYKI
jgi:hypothetical protein